VADTTDFGFVRPPTVKLYDVRDLAHPGQIAALVQRVDSLTFSPNSHLLAATFRNQLKIWDVTDPHQPVEQPSHFLTPNATVASVAFRPDGNLLAGGDSEGTIRLWHVQGDRLIGSSGVISGQGSAYRFAFSPDGRTLARLGQRTINGAQEVDADHIELWNIADPNTPIFRAVIVSSKELNMSPLAYSPDGEKLAALSSGQRVDLWNLNPDRAVRSICTSQGDLITPEEWNKYVPGKPYQPPCD
jgi:WD40 repeat protein